VNRGAAATAAAVAGALAVGVLGLPALLGAGSTGGVSEGPLDGVVTPPPDLNVVLAIVDDMDDFACRDAKAFLPASGRYLVDRGRCFENATVTDPVCCPARAEVQTGQMPHNNGVRRQQDARLLDVRDTVQARLGGRGVATYVVGKWLNGINPGRVMTGEQPTGFERADLFNSDDYYDYPLHDDQGRAYTTDPPVHATVRAGKYLNDFVADMAAADRRFHVHVGFHAPHTANGQGKGFTFPEPTPANAERAVPPFRFRPERDSQDKLRPFHGLDAGRGQGYLTRFHAARVRSLYDVDDQLAQTFAILEETGELERTAVFFLSDNGYHLGQNGWTGKATPYPASVRVPLLAFLPRAFGEGVVDRRPVGLVDIAATIYDLTDTDPGYELDGRSLLDPGRRTEGFHEYTNERSRFSIKESGHAPGNIPSWAAYITPGGSAYVEFYRKNGRLLARELYRDAGRRRNLLDPRRPGLAPQPQTVARLAARLAQLRTCRGQASANPCP
jgi:N-acetylglucosamine-6-sulfatase